MHGSRRLRDRYPAMLGMGVLFTLAAGVSVVASPLAGGVILAVGFTVLIGYVATRPAVLLQAAEQAPHPHGGRGHVLVVADAPLAGDELAEVIVRLAGPGPGPGAELDVLSPQLVSHTHFAMSDTDAEMRAAQARLKTSLEWAAAHGFRARGEVGADEPATAMADELRDFGADAVIIATNGDRKTGWAEARELERARAELDVPVLHVAVGR
jgi:nucleotide-binding universal stress UspA family protein